MLCKQCGTELPEYARFCLNCGSPAAEAPEIQAEEPPELGFRLRPVPPPPLDFVQPALAGGMFLGVLSTLPFISAGNCLCCIWVLGGGAIAAQLLMKQRPNGGVTFGDAAFGGVMSGLFGAVVGTVLSIPIKIVTNRLFEGQQEAMEDALQRLQVEGPLRDLFSRMAAPEITLTTVAFTFISSLLLYSLFAMIGGILAVAIVNKQKGRRQPPSPITN